MDQFLALAYAGARSLGLVPDGGSRPAAAAGAGVGAGGVAVHPVVHVGAGIEPVVPEHGPSATSVGATVAPVTVGASARDKKRKRGGFFFLEIRQPDEFRFVQVLNNFKGLIFPKFNYSIV
jgi:hypothetical protein